MRKRLFQIVSLLVITIVFGCSSSDSTVEEMEQSTEEQSENSDSEEEPPSETEDSILFSKISYENIIDGNVMARVEFQFEENKVIRQNGFNPNGILQNYSTYEYNNNGLLQKRIKFNADDSIDFINNFSYEDDKLVLIERIQRNLNDSLISYNEITYSGNLIENKFIGSTGTTISTTQYFIDADGFIFKSDNGISAEIILEDGLPKSKIVERPTNVMEFEHTYLNSPLPLGPWKDFWKNFYGSLNNQIVQNSGGLIDYEDTVDMEKYIISVGSQLQRVYEFNSDGLPVRIEKTFSNNFKSIWEMEYQE